MPETNKVTDLKFDNLLPQEALKSRGIYRNLVTSDGCVPISAIHKRNAWKRCISIFYRTVKSEDSIFQNRLKDHSSGADITATTSDSLSFIISHFSYKLLAKPPPSSACQKKLSTINNCSIQYFNTTKH